MSYGIEFPRGLPSRAQVSPTCVRPLWPFPPPPPATPGVGRSPASPVGPAKQANRIARFSRSLPSREQTCPDTASNQIQEGGIPERAEHCQGKQTSKTTTTKTHPRTIWGWHGGEQRRISVRGAVRKGLSREGQVALRSRGQKVASGVQGDGPAARVHSRREQQRPCGGNKGGMFKGQQTPRGLGAQ